MVVFRNTEMAKVDIIRPRGMSRLSSIVNTMIADQLATQGASAPGPLFTKRQDVLPPNLGKSRSREIGVIMTV